MSDKQGTSKAGKDGADLPLDRHVLTIAGVVVLARSSTGSRTRIGGGTYRSTFGCS